MKLHEQAKHYKHKSCYLEGQLRDLLHYVQSDKFSVDQMVNSADIQLRINETLNELYREFD